MKKKIIFLIIAVAFSAFAVTAQSKRSKRKTPRKPQPRFTFFGECDGGACHFQLISFRYGRNMSISVGTGDSSLSYYYNVNFSKGKTENSYLFIDEPNAHFVEKKSRKKVNPALNSILLDVYNLGMYYIENNLALPKKSFTERGKYAVLKRMRLYHTSTKFRANVINKSKLVQPIFAKHMPLNHRNVLQKWLATKTNWRPKTISDRLVGMPKDTIEIVRSQIKEQGEGFHPYYKSDDFNGDKRKDFAVIIINSKNKSAALAIFNAPFRNSPTFYKIADSSDWIFWVNDDEFENRILLSPPESHGSAITWKNTRYVIE